jgi:hypothetical protein
MKRNTEGVKTTSALERVDIDPAYQQLNIEEREKMAILKGKRKGAGSILIERFRSE